MLTPSSEHMDHLPLTTRTVQFGRLFWAHLRVYWIAYAMLSACAVMFAKNYRIGLNQTPSLPQSIFLIHLNEPAKMGDYIAFHTPAGAGFGHDAILTKIVAGVAGDVVTVVDRVVSVNGRPVGFAKPKSLKGDSLEPIPPSVIGDGQVYVMGLHKDSLDSRYSMVGLVSLRSAVGRAIPIW